MQRTRPTSKFFYFTSTQKLDTVGVPRGLWSYGNGKSRLKLSFWNGLPKDKTSVLLEICELLKSQVGVRKLANFIELYWFYQKQWSNILPEACWWLAEEYGKDETLTKIIKDAVQQFHPGKRKVQISHSKPQIIMTFMPMMCLSKYLTTTIKSVLGSES